MIVDRRKDSYDELQILAGDVRTRRRRANMVTTLLITGGIVGTVAYIATMNQQVDALAGERDLAIEQARVTQNKLFELEPILALAETRIQLYKEAADHFAQIAGAANIENNPTITGGSGGLAQPAPQQVAFNNFVWIADGSRRFPMTNRDVLWIPEARFWVRLDNPIVANGAPTTISRHTGSQPNTQDVLERLVVKNVPLVEYPINAGINNRGVANCVSLQLDDTSTRAGFNGYFDMDVTIFSKPNCGVETPYRFEMTAGDIVQVPDLPLWVRAEPPATGQTTPTMPTSVTLHTGSRPAQRANGANYNATEGWPLNLDNDDSRSAYANRVCIRMETMGGRSERPANFADVVIMLSDETSCPAQF